MERLLIVFYYWIDLKIKYMYLFIFEERFVRGRGEGVIMYKWFLKVYL